MLPHPSFIPHYCPQLKTDIVFVLQDTLLYSKYLFDITTNRFKTVECTDCRVVATEEELFPLYADWSEVLGRYVIFAFNTISGTVQQFVYEKKPKRFEEVHRPELGFDSTKKEEAKLIYTVDGVGDEGRTLIMRHFPKGNFQKRQYNPLIRRFEVLPPTPVLFLRENRDNFKPISIRWPRKQVPKPASIQNRWESDSKSYLQKWINTTDFDAAGEEVVYFEEKTIKSEIFNAEPAESGQISEEDANEIRRLAEIMGNPTTSDYDDDSDFL